MQANPQIQPPNIVAGFKNNIVPQMPQQPQISQMPQQMPQQLLPAPEIPQAIIPQQIIPQTPQQIIPQPSQQITVPLDAYAIFGYEIQKKYMYIIMIIVLGLVAYFVWKWLYGPKKSRKHRIPVEEHEEEEEEEEEEDDVYIPPYSKSNKKDDE